MKQTLTISSVIGGISPSYYAQTEGQYLGGFAIDPNSAVSDKIGGHISPTAYVAFSGTTKVNSAPMWILTNPKNNLIYSYLANGKLISYSNVLGSETLVGTATSGAGNGGAYYNNYIYLFTPTDASRYGPLNNSPSLTNTVWTGATLGSQTALANTSYLSGYPNHAAHEHFGSLYFCDFKNGQGLIHRITTKKTTDEGDTNDNSAYNVLDLPFGFMPTDIESFGEDLIISAVQTTDNITKQGPSMLFLWNTIDPAPYRKIPMQDALVTAMLNNNGVIHIFGGTAGVGAKHYSYKGGYSVTLEDSLPLGSAPAAGAVDAIGNRVIWPGITRAGYVTSAPAVMAKGYTDPQLPSTALNCIIQSGSSGATSITALKYIWQDSGLTPRIILGSNGSIPALEQTGSGGVNHSVFAYLFNIGKPFTIRRIRIPLTTAVSSTTSIAARVYCDQPTNPTVYDFSTINQANFDTKWAVALSKDAVRGENHFIVQFTFNGTDGNALALPILIDIDTFDDTTSK